MKEFLSNLFGTFEIINFPLESIIISIVISLVAFIFLIIKPIINKLKKRKFENLFRLDPSLEKEMKNFKSQPTKLIFHFIRLSDYNNIYQKLYITSQNKYYEIKEDDLEIDFTDNRYPYKYNIAEEIMLLGWGKSKTFIIMINKNAENHYNIMIDLFGNKITFSLEIIIYSKIKKYLDNVYNLESFKKYKKENNLPNMLRFNIINATESDLLSIYSFDIGKRGKKKLDKNIFSKCKENLLLNIIYSKDGKIAFKRIFDNDRENDIFTFTKDDINLLNDLYKKVIKKYIDTNPSEIINIKNFRNDFILFDKAHGYSCDIESTNNKEINIESDLRRIDF